MQNDYNILQLENGLRVVSQRAAGPVSYIGVAVNAGSRDESLDKQGLAHFVEHTIFKGTDRRRSSQISSRMELVGGELNAYTSKEETLVYTSASVGYSARAFELLGDIIANSRFPDSELEKERDVVVEEIYSYQDSPADSVFDEFEELIYAGSGLAHNILGTKESVKCLRSEDCRGFLDSFYTPENMVIYCVDNNSPDTVRRMAEKYFGHLHYDTAQHKRHAAPAVEVFSEVRNRGNHQANTIVGQRVFGRTDARRSALFLLNNYLGGPCMNSILNRELREKRGWVYTVDSNVSLMSDTGVLMVYFGCDPDRVDRCCKIIQKEIGRLAGDKLSARKLEEIKRQYCGQLILTADHKESRAMALAKSMLYYDEIHDIDTATQGINSVTAEQLRDVAAIVAGNGLSRLTLI